MPNATLLIRNSSLEDIHNAIAKIADWIQSRCSSLRADAEDVAHRAIALNLSLINTDGGKTSDHIYQVAIAAIDVQPWRYAPATERKQFQSLLARITSDSTLDEGIRAAAQETQDQLCVDQSTLDRQEESLTWISTFPFSGTPRMIAWAKVIAAQNTDAIAYYREQAIDLPREAEWWISVKDELSIIAQPV